ncbi:MAG: leucine-rich repeat domain-containing protein [Oscillospiraceae bacterium]|jgi:hypothetical protein|nr:leucine-rich repeat domain-containing protein [Oscillospiraceae bacterium]
MRFFVSGLVQVKFLESEKSCLTDVEGGAFFYNKSLEKIYLPNSVKTIGENTFTGCDGLKSFKIPDSLRCIKTRTFLKCHNLKEISIPSSIK